MLSPTIWICLVLLQGTPDEPSRAWTPQVGALALVHDPVRGATFAAADAFAYREMIQASRAGDTAGIKELLSQGRLSIVPHGTTCLVLEYTTNEFLVEQIPAALVRFKEGSLADRKGWVAAKFLVPSAGP